MKITKYILVFLLSYLTFCVADMLFDSTIDYLKNLILSMISIIGLYFQIKFSKNNE